MAAGDTCEVVILTGDARVGLVSDRKVSDQFDQVIKEHPPSSAHLVSDGAEDEFLFPILASRVRIDGVRRVFIRQNASIESTYYTLVRALKDPKLRAKTVLPFALMMLTLGIAAAAGVIWWGVIGLLVLLGIYLIFWTFDIDEALIDSVRSASTDIRQGSVAFGFGLFAIALVGIGFLSGYNVYVGAPSRSPLERILFFANYAFIWWVIAGVIWEGGRAIRRYLVRGRFSRTFPIATTSIIGLGFLGYGIVYLVEYPGEHRLEPRLHRGDGGRDHARPHPGHQRGDPAALPALSRSRGQRRVVPDLIGGHRASDMALHGRRAGFLGPGGRRRDRVMTMPEPVDPFHQRAVEYGDDP